MGEVKNWASILDDNTRLQAEMLSRSQVMAGHVALMPDAHLGKGATVGSVIPTIGAVIPAAIGVDIGCGMIAVRTTTELPQDLTPLHGEIARSVKSGWGKSGSWHDPRKGAQQWVAEHAPSDRVKGMVESAILQLGTLGSGNHFIEVNKDEGDRTWVVIHSGSRGVGNKLAVRHINIAKELCKQDGVHLEDPDLAFLSEPSPEFDEYIEDMQWAQLYARFNREVMMDAVLDQLYRFAGGEEVQRINCHHNFTQRERHFGRDVWLTRKGAIRAGDGELGVVPGSMAIGTYITEGLGNPDSYLSSAHGAGRQMSRGQAKRTLSLEGVDGLYPLMQGIAWDHDNAQALLDEHPSAYKPLEEVMEDQKDLCRPIHRLRPVLNYKGT